MRLKSIGFLLLLTSGSAGCGTSPPASPAEVIAIYRNVLPSDPSEAIWREAPLHVAPMLVQDMVEPRLLDPSVAEVKVQAVTDGARVSFLLNWEDGTQDDLPGMGRFADACAVQLPMRPSADVPAPQMGEVGRWVEITYWSAAWQAAVDGRTDTIREIYPGATVDHYPFEAPPLEKGSPAQQELANLFAPARNLGNLRAGPRTIPVEDLVAEGPGTLVPAEKSFSAGTGRRTAQGWTVILSRPLPDGIRRGDRTQAAFAVWEGSHREVGSKKMRTVWIPLYIEGAP